MMEYRFAPMEGISDAVYRKVHREFFPGIDRYYTPFLSPNQNWKFSTKELREILPEWNEGVPLVPQLLCRNTADFLWAAEEIAKLGYPEINLNLGCPSGTVTAKKKGAGMLGDPDELDRFLDVVCRAMPVKLSVKTRLGMADPEEFYRILRIYNRYPLCEVILHPRTRPEFYKGTVHREYYGYALEHSRCPVCYNGDLNTPEDVAELCREFPQTNAVMIGRGLVRDPALVRQIRSGQKLTKEEIFLFHEALFDAYSSAFGSAQNAVPRMKEIWSYLIRWFADAERAEKAIRKASRKDEFDLAVSQVRSLRFQESL